MFVKRRVRNWARTVLMRFVRKCRTRKFSLLLRQNRINYEKYILTYAQRRLMGSRMVIVCVVVVVATFTWHHGEHAASTQCTTLPCREMWGESESTMTTGQSEYIMLVWHKLPSREYNLSNRPQICTAQSDAPHKLWFRLSCVWRAICCGRARNYARASCKSNIARYHCVAISGKCTR